MKKLQVILPSVYGYIALILMLILHFFAPVMDLLDPPYTFLGYLPLFIGVALILVCVLEYSHSGTAIMPFEKSRVLLTQGAYKYSRHPIYLGMLAIVTGTAIVLGSLSPFFLVPVYYLILHYGYIKYEEKFLEDQFGEDYLLYKSRVRRWF